MDLTAYRESSSEKIRTADLIRMIQTVHGTAHNALDIGARDGHFSKLLTSNFDHVIALDLETPSIRHANITCVQGDVTNLKFPDNSIDFVFCTEVLEHIPTNLLEKACYELSRVSRKYLLVGVPYKQDIRVGRTTCYSCGIKNPPWGHVNIFDEKRLISLFPLFISIELSFVGKINSATNLISTILMDLAGNPYGTYSQDEPCINCGKKLHSPPERTLLQKILTRASLNLTEFQKLFVKEHASWIHILFQKK